MLVNWKHVTPGESGRAGCSKELSVGGWGGGRGGGTGPLKRPLWVQDFSVASQTLGEPVGGTMRIILGFCLSSLEFST